MDHLDQAIYDVVHNSDVDAKGISKRLGLSHQVLINKANPQSVSHKLNVREAVAIQMITGNFAILKAMEMELSLSTQTRTPMSVLECALDAAKENGDVFAAVKKAMEDGRLTHREKADCFREIDEAVDALNQLRESLELTGKTLKIAK